MPPSDPVPESEKPFIKNPPKFKSDIEGSFEGTDPLSPAYAPENMIKWFNQTGGEFHVTGYNFLGPRTLFALRNIGDNGDYYKTVMTDAGLEPVGTYPYDKPIDYIDEAAFEHDRVYSNKDATADEIREADNAFIIAVKSVKLPPKSLEIALAQIAGYAIRLKTLAEDAFVISPGVFSESAKRNFTRMVYGRNESLPEDINHATFWGLVVSAFFRGIGWLRDQSLEAGLTTGSSIGITLIGRLARRKKDSDFGRFIFSLARKLGNNAEPSELIRSAEQMIETASEQLIQSWFEEWNIGIQGSGELMQFITRYGIREYLIALVNKLPDWIAVSLKSDDWLDRNAVTEDDIQRVMKRQMDEGRRPGIDITTTEVRDLSNAMRDIPNQTQAERIKNVLSILRVIRDVNPVLPSKVNAIRKALEDGKVFDKIRILKGYTTMQVIRSILREKIPQSATRVLIRDFWTALSIRGETTGEFKSRLEGMTYIDLISQYATLREFADFFK